MAPILYDILSPLIQDTIISTVNASIGQIKTIVLDEMVKFNNELIFTKQPENINSQSLNRQTIGVAILHKRKNLVPSLRH